MKKKKIPATNGDLAEIVRDRDKLRGKLHAMMSIERLRVQWNADVPAVSQNEIEDLETDIAALGEAIRRRIKRTYPRSGSN